MTSEKRISCREFLGLFFRSLCLEWSWNYGKQQNLGYSFIMNSFEVRRFPDNKTEITKENLRNFNTNPYLATYLFGVVAFSDISMEQYDPIHIERLINTLMPPIAAIGDRWFWGGLRVISVIPAIELAIRGSWLAPFIFLILFNLPALIIRWCALVVGIKQGVSFLFKLENSHILDTINEVINKIQVLMLGSLTAYLVTELIPIFLPYKLVQFQLNINWYLPGLVGGVMVLILYLINQKLNIFFTTVIGIVAFSVLNIFLI